MGRLNAYASTVLITKWLAMNRAIDILVPIIANPAVDQSVRQRWLERLWEAVENDGMTYIESLGGYWGECSM